MRLSSWTSPRRDRREHIHTTILYKSTLISEVFLANQTSTPHSPFGRKPMKTCWNFLSPSTKKYLSSIAIMKSRVDLHTWRCTNSYLQNFVHTVWMYFYFLHKHTFAGNNIEISYTERWHVVVIEWYTKYRFREESYKWLDTRRGPLLSSMSFFFICSRDFLRRRHVSFPFKMFLMVMSRFQH